MKALLFFISLLSLNYNIAQASPLKDLKLVGATEMNWLFWKIYDIQLMSPDGEFDRDKYPLALIIRYARDIDSSMLIKTTLDEWQRQQITWKAEWRDLLSSMWPDVGRGDEIILRVDQDMRSHFFFNRKLLGSIHDVEFAPAFLDIWLSENTLKPDLRRQLTGSF